MSEELGTRPAVVDQDPAAFTLRTTAPWGEEVRVRLLKAEDRQILGDYFLGLSQATVGIYRPHGFDRQTADALCSALADDPALRFVAVDGPEDNERIIGYFILLCDIIPSDKERYATVRNIVLDPAVDCQLAPSVADAYQSKGLGSMMLTHVIEVARRLGRRRLVLLGGVRQANRRAIHFYEKFGFRKMGEFMARAPSFDMYADL